MKIETRFRTVLDMRRLLIPKSKLPRQMLLGEFGTEFEENPDSWSLKCHHELRPPAKAEELASVTASLRLDLTGELRELLNCSNGMKLFVVPKHGTDIDFEAEHVRYRVFGTDELIKVNKSLFSNFRDCLGTDSGYKDIMETNYVAFCDADNGNYLGILLEGPERGKVFFVNCEYYYSPYSDKTRDLYYTIAPTLADWLILVTNTGGWGGRGHDSGAI